MSLLPPSFSLSIPTHIDIFWKDNDQYSHPMSSKHKHALATVEIQNTFTRFDTNAQHMLAKLEKHGEHKA